MHATSDRLEFAPPPPPGLLRAMGLAVLAHAFLLAALTWGVHWKRQDVSVAVEAELWSALPREAAPRLVAPPPVPVEKPQPKPAPKPAPVPDKMRPPVPDPAIALEREKRLKKEKERQEALQKLEQARVEQEKLQLLKKRELEKKALEDKKKAEQDAKHKAALKQAEQEAARLEAQRRENIQRMQGLAGASGGATARGNALQASGPSAGYAGRIRAAIRPNIVFTEEVTGNPMAEVEVRTAPNGTIINHRLLTSSGVKAWDEAVLKAIDKTGELPRDVDGRVPPSLIVTFRPKD